MRAGLVALCVAVAACGAGPVAAERDSVPPLPEPLANNATAVVHTPAGPWLISFLGLGAGKTWQDITDAAWVLPPGAEAWQRFPDTPGPGRIAATAAVVGDTVYLFGGYTVAQDHSEKSIETVYAVDLEKRRYRELPPMPIPVDDAASVVYAERYIYLVSGWHDSGNVNLVQVFDTKEESWFQATPYPGKPVFGHAGGIAGNTLIMCDGVGIVTTEGDREFAAVQACYRGAIRQPNPARIDWTTLPPHPGPALYRMAATGDATRVIFAGGSDNPYNFNGIGYNEVPSAPSDLVFWYDLERNAWISGESMSKASMDHRALLALGGNRFAIVGGMLADQTVTADANVFTLQAAQ